MSTVYCEILQLEDLSQALENCVDLLSSNTVKLLKMHQQKHLERWGRKSFTSLQSAEERNPRLHLTITETLSSMSVYISRAYIYSEMEPTTIIVMTNKIEDPEYVYDG